MRHNDILRKVVEQMKKLFSLVLALVLAAGLATSAFAATNFVSSPSGKVLPAVDIVIDGFTEVTNPTQPLQRGQYRITEDNDTIKVEVKELDGCDDELIVTPYSEKGGMPANCPQTTENKEKAEEAKEMLEAAYTEVTTIGEGKLANLPTHSGVDFKGDLTKAAKAAGTTVDNIYVSDLFDITYYHVGTVASGHQENHQKKYTIKVDETTLKNYVALLHRHSGDTVDSNGIAWTGEEWKVVPNVEVDLQNQTISFVIKNVETDLSPFAIVVKKTAGGGSIDGPTSPKTADPMSLVTLAMALTASAGGLVVLGKRKHD